MSKPKPCNYNCSTCVADKVTEDMRIALFIDEIAKVEGYEPKTKAYNQFKKIVRESLQKHQLIFS